MGLKEPNYFDSAVLDQTTSSALPKCSHPCYPINDLSAKLKTALTLDPDGPSACPTLVCSLPIQPETDSVLILRPFKRPCVRDVPDDVDENCNQGNLSYNISPVLMRQLIAVVILKVTTLTSF